MKQLLKMTAFAVLAMSLFTFGKCKNDLVIPYTGSFDVVLTANPAGTKTFGKTDIENAVVKFLTDKKISTTNVSSIELESVVATIPAGSALDFSQLSSATFSLGGTDVAEIKTPPALSGKTLTQKVIKADVKAILLATKTSYGLSVTTNTATVAETVKVAYTVNIGYTL
jgi:hypothetical protein